MTHAAIVYILISRLPLHLSDCCVSEAESGMPNATPLIASLWKVKLKVIDPVGSVPHYPMPPGTYIRLLSYTSASKEVFLNASIVTNTSVTDRLATQRYGALAPH